MRVASIYAGLVAPLALLAADAGCARRPPGLL
jgi:hypothetical protein